MLAKRIKADQLDAKNIESVVEALEKNKLIVVPTETIYGVASSMDEGAFKALYKAKKRPFDKPLPVLVSSLEQVRQVADKIPEKFWMLAENFLPGPLTVILKKNPSLNFSCLNQDTVAIRFSSHQVTQTVVRNFGRPMFLSSANISGQTNACSVQEIEASIGNNVEFILDGGPLADPVPSTIVSLAGENPKIIRQGSIKEEDIFQLWS